MITEDRAQQLAAHLRQWMLDLKVDSQKNFLPAEARYHMTGIVPFEQGMAKQILDFLNSDSEVPMIRMEKKKELKCNH